MTLESLPTNSLRALVANVHPLGNLAAFRQRAVAELTRRAAARTERDTETRHAPQRQAQGTGERLAAGTALAAAGTSR